MTTSEFINQNLNGISKYRLSKLSGISAQLINAYCKGVSEPNINNFKAIVKALNIHQNDLNNFIYEN
jgi:transcriptional regulator with XRE-family HTH domain